MFSQSIHRRINKWLKSHSLEFFHKHSHCGASDCKIGNSKTVIRHNKKTRLRGSAPFPASLRGERSSCAKSLSVMLFAASSKAKLGPPDAVPLYVFLVKVI